MPQLIRMRFPFIVQFGTHLFTFGNETSRCFSFLIYCQQLSQTHTEFINFLPETFPQLFINLFYTFALQNMTLSCIFNAFGFSLLELKFGRLFLNEICWLCFRPLLPQQATTERCFVPFWTSTCCRLSINLIHLAIHTSLHRWKFSKLLFTVVFGSWCAKKWRKTHLYLPILCINIYLRNCYV